jgi:hypothetical protein
MKLRAAFFTFPNLPRGLDERPIDSQNGEPSAPSQISPAANNVMTKGISEQSKQLRRHLLNHNAPDVMQRMQQSGMADPVGMIIEMTDDIGKQLTYAALEKQGMPKHEIPELIASYCKNAIPTFKCVVSFDTARKILPITSETALQNLNAPRKPGVHWIVVVGGGGNSYAQIPAQ